MSLRKLTAVLLAGGSIVAALAACGQQAPLGSSGASAPPVASGATFPAGSTMAKLASAGTVRVGTKFDQPLFGLKGLDGKPVGFDVEIAKIVAAKLGIPADKITYTETPSKIREDVIVNNQVDMVVATYTINDARKQKVSFAGPVLRRGPGPDGEGRQHRDHRPGHRSRPRTPGSARSAARRPPRTSRSTSTRRNIVLFDVYSKCADALRNGQVEAVTTDNVILAGLVSTSQGAFKLVGKPFTKEPYGIGIAKGDTAFCQFIDDTLKAAGDRRQLRGGVEGHGRLGAARRAAAADRRRLQLTCSHRAGRRGAARPVPSASEVCLVDALVAEFPRFVEGFFGTLRISLFAAVGALVLGTLLAAFRVSPLPPLRLDRHRVGHGVPQLAARGDAVRVRLRAAAGRACTFPTLGGNAFFWPGVTALACYTAAFVCEAVRSGINSVPPGQAEAARAVGLTFQQTLQRCRAPAGAAHRRATAGQRHHRDDQELGDRRRVRRHRRAVLGRRGQHRAGLLRAVQPHRRRHRLPGDHHPGRARARRHRAADRGQTMTRVSTTFPAPSPAAAPRSARLSRGWRWPGWSCSCSCQLGANGQFDGAKWGPLFNPANPYFLAVWAALGDGLANTLMAAALTLVLALSHRHAAGGGPRCRARGPTGGWSSSVIELLRGLPVVITIYFASRVLPEIGISLPPLWYLVIGLTAYNCVIIAEILRAGVAALPRGQTEAALPSG